MQQGPFWEVDNTHRRITGNYHAKMAAKLEKVDFSVLTSSSSIKTLGILMLLAARFQPVITNESPIILSETMDSYETEASTTEIFSANNSTASYLQCETGSRALGTQQTRSFTLLEQHCSHSGAFTLNRKITTLEGITNARIKDFVKLGESGKLPSEASEEELIHIYEKRLPSFTGVYTFNGRPVRATYDYMIAQTHYEDALKWAEKELLTQDFSNTKTVQLIYLFNTLNKLLNGKKDLKTSPFREGVVVIWDDSGNTPNFDQPEEMRKYLYQHSPSELSLYNSLCRTLESLEGPEALSSMDQWNIFMIKNVFKVKNSPHRTFVDKYCTYNNSSPSEIQKRLREAINDYKRFCSQDPIRASAQLHLDLVNIHPYEDANGRTARIVMNIALKQAGYPAVIAYNPRQYIQAIKQSLRQNKPDIFIEYVKRQICKQVELYNDPEFKEGRVLKDIADNCEFDCSQKFFEVSYQKFNL